MMNAFFWDHRVLVGSLPPFVLVGPPDDSCGLFAGELLAGLGDEFKGRLFVCTKLLGCFSRSQACVSLKCQTNS